MKRAGIAAVLVFMLATTLSSSAFDDGKQYSCGATAGLAVNGVTGDAPACGFELLCVGGPGATCAYLVRVDASGAGLVAGAMSARGPGAVIRFVDLTSGGSVDALSCSGAFSCSSTDSGTTALLVEIEPGFGAAIVTVDCTGGGLAVVETVHCSATSVTNQEA